MPETEIPDWVSEWRAAYSVLFIKSIAGEALPIAVLLLDILNDRLFFRFRGDLPAIADKQSLAVIEGMRDELADWASEQSATALFRMFLDTLSNSITMSDPREVAPDSNPIESLDRIFAQEIPNSKSFRV